MWRVWGRKEGCTGCWWGNLRERGRWGDPDVDRRIILRWMFRKWEMVVYDREEWKRLMRRARSHRILHMAME
jgi:hypothetical protein